MRVHEGKRGLGVEHSFGDDSEPVCGIGSVPESRVGGIWMPHKASFLFREADPAREFGNAGVEPGRGREIMEFAVGLDGGRRMDGHQG